MIYDWIPKIEFMNTTVDIIFFIFLFMTLVVSYRSMRRYTKYSRFDCSFASILITAVVLYSRGFIWQIIEYALFGFTESQIGGFRSQLVFFVPITVYTLYKLRDNIALGRNTKIIIILICFYFISWIFLDYADFRKPLTCTKASPDFMFFHFILGKILFVPLTAMIFKDGVGKHDKEKEINLVAQV